MTENTKIWANMVLKSSQAGLLWGKSPNLKLKRLLIYRLIFMLVNTIVVSLNAPSGDSRASLISHQSHLQTHYSSENGVAGFDVHNDDSCHSCFRGCRPKGSTTSCAQPPINEARGPSDQWEGRTRRSGELGIRLPRPSYTSICPSSFLPAPLLWSPSFKK